MNQATSKVNGDDAALQVDFSENANLMFTAFVWLSASLMNYNTPNSMSSHSWMDLKTKYPAIKNLSIFSDGANSQFKNRSSYSQIFICGKTSIM